MTPGATGPAGPDSWLGFADYLRRALQAAADQVDPQPDGLVPIRARILAGSGVPWHQAFAISRYWIHDA